ncbi:SDR family NAD(P)-dependent oxidoreductase [Paraglaciecola chathamensis]|uniref:Dehydrogenase/reductase SDR family protein member 10 n=1 Tax=Paraglaciecola chathamensis S18K6 TaxID=1127672 RepID=A0AAV3V7L7_9ALTE|nr:SDR family oxidoreductase [Paraglaciecola chathamensis]GAC12584.1 dehydrogenase/reductase SDR family protein member 10 [Paraglaciecola chathamensis S18K6]
MDLGFADKRVIVTGGSRGIGHATVQTLINEGAAVATCARGAEALEAALAQWQKQGGTAYGASVDVSDSQAFARWFELAVEQLGGLDVFVSNVTSKNEYSGEARWEQAFEADLMQHIRATEMALPHLRKGKDASIVYIASIASIMSANMPTETEYGAMKAALISYASQLAHKLGKENIRVNLLSPGPIYHKNGFWQGVEKHQPDLYKRAQALSVFNRLGTAQEVANATAFLASPVASNITGINLRVDGGTIKTVNF